MRTLNQLVSSQSVVLFRVVFGLVLAYQAWTLCLGFDAEAIRHHWVAIPFHFKYLGFEWVQPWPGHGMLIQFIIMMPLGLGVALGYRYRTCLALYLLAYTHTYLVEQLLYQNHLYLVFLLGLLMLLVKADAKTTLPAWNVGLLRFQFGVVYFFGGLAKINKDWLHGEPIRGWLALRLPQLSNEVTVYTMAYGGLLFDLAIVPLLLWKKTRVVAFVAALLFHLTNAFLFDISVFPWLMIAGTSLFFSPSWPSSFRAKSNTPPSPSPISPPGIPLKIFIGGFILVQLFLPLRHHLYPGNVNWTEEGFRFAWHMKLNHKEGLARFQVLNTTTGERWTIDPDQYLRNWQTRRMAYSPDALHQFSRFLEKTYRQESTDRVEVRVAAMASLNRHEPQLIIDPNIDLAHQPRTWKSSSWIRKN